MPDSFLAFPLQLCPAFAPLPLAFANHLAEQTYRRRRIVAHKRLTSEQIHARLLSSIEQARHIVFEYLTPFILADQRQGKGYRSFPQSEWLLDTLATYTPKGKRLSEATLDYWIKRGILRREHARGPFDLTSVAALLIARIVEEQHQRNWRSSELDEYEAHWWCYGQLAPDAPLLPVPVPFPSSLPASALLRTPWLGVTWEDSSWQIAGDMAYRWAGSFSCGEEVKIWDETFATLIIDGRDNLLLGQAPVQQYLAQQASHLILEHMLQGKGDSQNGV